MTMGHADEDGRRVDNQWILVVEDSAEDAEAIERALNRTHPDLRLEFTDRGEESPNDSWTRPNCPASYCWTSTCRVRAGIPCSARSAVIRSSRRSP